MKPISRILIATKILLVLAGVPLIWYSMAPETHERDLAAARYQQTLSEFNRTNNGLKEIENKLSLLTTSVDAVELEVRAQLRMIKPGEKHLLIEYSKPYPSAPSESVPQEN